MINSKGRMLLHICCAPDATVPVADLQAEGWEVMGFFYGSNIQPEQEYHKRLDALHTLMSRYDFPVEEALYAPDEWLAHMREADLLGEPEGGRRCTECFTLQLTAAARAAVKFGCSQVCSSLTISPHKNVVRITDIGTVAAREQGVLWEPRIWRKRDGFLRSIKMSKELGLYRQNYCGCLPSIVTCSTPLKPIIYMVSTRVCDIMKLSLN